MNYPHFLLTWEIAPEARLGSDHPFCSGLTEDCNGAFGLLPESCQSTTKLNDYRVQFIVGQPSILPKDQLAGQKRRRKKKKVSCYIRHFPSSQTYFTPKKMNR